MPLHYIISELAISMVSAWGAWRLVRAQQLLGASGVALFALAAAIGILRIASGAEALLAPAHRLASQAGGTFALVLIVAQIAKHRGWTAPLLVICAGASGAALASLASAVLGGLIFLVLLVVGAALLATQPHSKHRALAALGFVLMAPNILFIRQSVFLDPALSWHGFHFITALWLIGVVAALRSAQQRSAEPLASHR
ncbi:hypothetical protein [Candidatus Viadribacter manganicus]|uniref:Transmembrane protein n=1 Tax=Candidatus Viadribacter manganicus TaxID=1759059 RepID=A0A1B1AGQ3_9PROT|nr:hypothetical protein [Candidatus Viadribacter manganicus]ANP45746.1 hypothetical protein ATE48_07345 [Candidatus Viadribacter manganicus]